MYQQTCHYHLHAPNMILIKLTHIPLYLQCYFQLSGAVMFLFEGTFGNILHTGDCRLTPECLQRLPEKYLGKTSREPKCRLDYIFLDCTFATFSSKMPSKHLAIRQVDIFSFLRAIKTLTLFCRNYT